jgi:hypothetical protein
VWESFNTNICVGILVRNRFFQKYGKYVKPFLDTGLLFLLIFLPKIPFFSGNFHFWENL